MNPPALRDLFRWPLVSNISVEHVFDPPQGSLTVMSSRPGGESLLDEVRGLRFEMNQVRSELVKMPRAVAIVSRDMVQQSK